MPDSTPDIPALDTALVMAAERAATGAHIHRVNGLLAKYKNAVALVPRCAETGRPERAVYWKEKVPEYEDELRLVLAEIADAEWQAKHNRMERGRPEEVVAVYSIRDEDSIDAAVQRILKTKPVPLWVQCSQCGHGHSRSPAEEEVDGSLDGRACPHCGIGILRVTAETPLPETEEPSND